MSQVKLGRLEYLNDRLMFEVVQEAQSTCYQLLSLLVGLFSEEFTVLLRHYMI